MPLSLAWRLDPIVRLVYRLKGPAHIQTRLNTLSAVATRGVCEGCRMCEVGRLGPAAALAIGSLTETRSPHPHGALTAGLT